MSTFNVPIKRIRSIEAHPNADAIEFAVIDGYRSIVKKGEMREGDLVAYIPESSIVPPWLLKRIGLWNDVDGCGKLSGKEGNRVKAIRLRGELSQGICYPVVRDTNLGGQIITGEGPGSFAWVIEDENVAGLLGIKKYDPPIPVAMAGEVFNAGTELTLAFDVENWQSYPNILQHGEEVIFTEKLHGTCTVVAILPYKHAHHEAFGERRNVLIFSKGLGAKGLVLKNNERNRDNLYVRATRALVSAIDARQRDDDVGSDTPLFILGETFGPGVQDLTYGKDLGLRVFAAARGYRGEQRFHDWAVVEGDLRAAYGFETVPVMYRGAFSVDAMREHAAGRTTMQSDHIREGIVMVPATERFDPSIGRVCLKSISPDYLVRKGGTEYN